MTSPTVSSTRAPLTQQTSRLEPGTLDHKLYFRGIGTLREQAVRGPLERMVLQSAR